MGRAAFEGPVANCNEELLPFMFCNPTRDTGALDGFAMFRASAGISRHFERLARLFTREISSIVL